MLSGTLKRILSLLNKLEASPQGLTAAELGEITNYPAGQVLDDLNEISCNTDLGGYFALYTAEDGILDDACVEDDVDFVLPVDFRVKNENVKWFLTVRDVPYPVTRLTLRDAVALLWLFDEFKPPDGLHTLWEKLMERVLPAGDAAATREAALSLHAQGGAALVYGEYLADLRNALLQEKKVMLRYYAKNLDEVVDWVLWPLGLVFHTGNGAWYLVARRDDNGETVVCHGERIRSMVKLNEVFEYPEDFSMSEYLRYRWGMDMSPPEVVRVRFYNDANVVEKVLREFHARGLPRPQELPGGHLEYYGEILGIRNFSKWVLSFGSSAEVLEPLWLREEMIQIAMKWDQLYNREE